MAFGIHLGKGLEIGSSLPGVVATDHSGADFDLRAFGASGWLLVFFFPKAETPGCVAQACSLRDAYEQLTDRGVKVVGVSQDSAEAQSRFRESRSLPYPLLADDKGVVVKAFGVPTAFGLSKRQAYLFRDGILVWKDASASTKEQAKDVLAAVETLSASK